jgi:uncharacterized protein (DUF2267 family)
MFMPLENAEFGTPENKETRRIETADDLHQEIMSSLVGAGQSKEDLMKNRLANRVFTHMMRERMFANATAETVQKAVIHVLDNLQ